MSIVIRMTVMLMWTIFHVKNGESRPSDDRRVARMEWSEMRDSRMSRLTPLIRATQTGYPNPPISTNIPGQRAAARRHSPAAPEGERHGTIRSQR
jgi:hypothetical protein